MPRYDIEQWEHETAEIEIRRWLTTMGLWAPEVEFERLETRQTEEPLGLLTPHEIDMILRSEFVGRIGCHAYQRTYVVPIFYAYDGQYIYGHSGEGMKIQMMRTNPSVCFEVDHTRNLTNWESVIAMGRFEELQGHAAEHAMQQLIERMIALHSGAVIDPTPGADGALSGRNLVVYRIALEERTGRFERR